ncbi:hypothetical protein A2V55_00730 [Candidatus Woesebacteria bacterium RBG_19FT_COMBO_37_29]|uniref:Uncharacterized protein n=2 Tax=Candidatus Woeseibacteriota TaxID=1752722 RepID=A0A1F7XPS0_9BACT|nr:MAG: hypothetical protein A2V55_00730 [Candidatus Woesebacteria bacterium RBG_19FT_COMBO_37_29]
MNGKIYQKVFHIFYSILFLLNSFYGYFFSIIPAYAQEVTPESTTIPQDVTPPPSTETPLSSTEATPTETPQIEASILPSPTVSSEPDNLVLGTETLNADVLTNTSQVATESATSNTETILPDTDLTSSPTESSAQLIPNIFTDKSDYSPTDVVTITGSGFQPNTIYELVITSETGNYRFSDKITSNESGAIFYVYQLDGTYRPNYKVEIILGGNVVSTTNFTDTTLKTDFKQCANQDPTLGSCHWIVSALQNNNSEYGEGMSVPQRLLFTDIPTSSGDIHTLTFKHQATKGGVHAYDFLTAYNQGNVLPITLNPCNDFGGSDEATCNSLRAGLNTSIVDAPDDPFISKDGLTQDRINAFEATFGNRTITIYGNSAITSASFTSITHGVANNGDTGDSFVLYTLTWTSSSSNILIEMAGHLALSVDTGIGWGVNLGAGSVSGGPYHFKLEQFDGGAIGSQDNQIQAGAVTPPSSITIVKDSQPGDPQDFNFTTLGSGLSNFILDDDSGSDATYLNTKTFNGLFSGAYTVTETTVLGWTLSPITCISGGTGSTFSQITNGITINLVAGENVTCTFTNIRAQVAPTVTTAIHNPDHTVITSVPAGITVHDSVNVSGIYGTPTGDVTFNWYTNGTCSGTPSATLGSFTLSGGLVDATTFTQGPLNAGAYSFNAHYAGDSNYFAADSACEPLTINRLSPSVSTDIHNVDHNIVTSIPAGTTVHDLASVSGSFGIPTGSVDFTFYTSSDCSTGSSSSGSGIALVGGIAHPSSNQGPLTAGSYSFKAHYNGDGNYEAGDGACEPLTVNKVNTTVTTQVHNSQHTDITGGSVPLGSVVHDYSTVGGKVDDINITGTVTYHYYNNGSCDDTALSNETLSVGSESSDTSYLAAGQYSYQADYSGDSNYNSSTGACEPFSVNQAGITLITELHQLGEAVVNVGSSVPLGTTMHDMATVSGMVDSLDITGNVTFTFYNNGTCDGTGISAGTIDLIFGVVHPSYSEGPLSVGAYSFKAHYNGNLNYSGVDSACENFTVAKDNLTISTAIHNEAEDIITSTDLGSTIHDSATVGGINSTFVPTNPVQFTFYNNGTCEGSGDSAGSVALSGNYAHPSGSEGPLAAGEYSFKASIAEDSNYNGAVSDCEPLTVNKAQLDVTTIVHDATHNDKTNSTVPLASVMHDTATVIGVVDGFTTPTPSFTLTSNYSRTCNSGIPVANNGTENGSYKSADSSNLTAGTYAYRASISGNDNYLGDDSDCEPFMVGKAETEVTTEVHNASHADITNTSVALGTTIHDNAVVGTEIDSLPITGTITYGFYDSIDCTGDLVDETVNLGIESTSQTPGAGYYSYKVAYSGNNNYNGSIGICEPITIDKAQLNITTAVHDASHFDKTNSSVRVDSIMHDTASISGGVNGFTLPPVSFTLTSGYTGNCNEGVVVGSDGIDPSGMLKSADSLSLAVGRYAYRATVSGNDNYLGADSICEPFSVVNAKISITPGVDSNEVDDPHNFNVTVSQDIGDGFNWTGVEGAIVNVMVNPNPNGGLNKDDCLDGTNSNGECTAVINSSQAGIFTARARSTILINGVEFKLETNGSGDNSASATKTYVDGSIFISPPTATNNIGEAHTITADVTADDGSGTSNAVGVTITFSITSGLATFMGDDNDCITDNTGHCSVQIISDTPGSNTIDATTTFNIGSVTITRATNGNSGPLGSESAEKTYQAGNIIVIKHTIPEGASQSFEFDPSWSTSNFNLTDGQQYDSGYLAPGIYSVTELIPQGNWDLTDMVCGYEGSPSEINLAAGETITCVFTNVLRQPEITIEKSNDKPAASAGDTVNYTLKVKNTGDVALSNIVVTDILPTGFSYVNGTANVDKLGVTDEPNVNGQILKWNISLMNPDEEVVITYQVKISSDQKAAKYTNLATCDALDREETAVHCNNGNPVWSDVTLGFSNQYGGNLTSQVLGISTELPATGSPTTILLGALLLLLVGLLFKFGGKKNFPNLYKIMNKIKKNFKLSVILAIFALGLSVGHVKAVNTTVDISQLPQYTNQTVFSISYTAISDDPANIKAQFYYSKEGEGLQILGPQFTGPSNEFEVTGAQVNEGNKKYYFKVIVTYGSDTVSDETSTYFDNSGPDTPSAYSKERIGSTTYKIKWHSPSNDDFAQVLIYRGENPDFSADSGHFVFAQGGLKNTDFEWIDNGLDPNKNYYYLLRALDFAGNSSGLVGDTFVTTGTSTVTSQSPLPASGQVRVLPKEEGQGGQVLGQEETQGTPTPVPTQAGGVVGKVVEFAKNRTKITVLIVAVIVIGGYLIYRRLRSQKS